MNIISIHPTDLKGSFVGETEVKVARLFDLAESMDAIIEIDTPGELKKQYLTASQFKLQAEKKQNTFRNRLRDTLYVVQLGLELIQYLREKGFG